MAKRNPGKAQRARRSLAANIRRARLDRSLTQEQLAETLGIQVRHLSDLERARRAPSFDLLVALSSELHVTPAELLRDRELQPSVRGRPAVGVREGGGELTPVRPAQASGEPAESHAVNPDDDDSEE